MNSSRPNESMIVNETMNNLKNPNRLNFKLYWRLSRGV